MKPDIIDFVGNARKRKSDRFRNQFYIFLVCLVLSVFIWLLVRLSKEYDYTVSYQLKFTNIPGNLHLTGLSDSVVTLSLRVQGFDFFSERYLTGNRHRFEVSLGDIKIKNRENRLTGYLLSSAIAREIAIQTGYPPGIFSAYPDTLFFTFEHSSIRRMQPIPANRFQEGVLNRINDSVTIHTDSLTNANKSKEEKKAGNHK